MSNFEDVKVFMQTFGQRVIVKPKVPDHKTMQLRYELIEEELNELKEAMMNLSAVSPRVRSCCDIDYIKLTARFSNWYEISK